jgi:DNA-binding SARP family transcriptional activator
VRRECVAERFWGASCQARQRSALNSAIWRIGRKMPLHPGLQLSATDATLCLTIDPSIPVDVRDLSTLVHAACTASGLTPETASRLSTIVAACDAPFMDGFDAEWTLAERERIANIRIRGMIALMHWYGDNRQFEDALEIGRRLLAEDPFREAVQIDIMWLYVLNGQRAQAIRQYDAFAVLLKAELAIDPLPETQALYDHIRTGLDAEAPTGCAAAAALPSSRTLSNVLAAAEDSRLHFFQRLRSQIG